MKVYIITEKTLKTTFSLLVGGTIEEAAKFIGKRIIEKTPEILCCDGFYTHGSDKQQYQRDFIWIRSFTGKPEEIQNLAHELIHLVFRNFEDMGAPVSIAMNEPIAYTYGYLIGKCFKVLKKKSNFKEIKIH